MTTAIARAMTRVIITLLMLFCGNLPAQEYFGNESGAANGADVVAYFTAGEATPGIAEFQHEWRGSTWRFATQAHVDLFVANPEHYVPQFGGAGALTIAHGARFPGNPAAWSIYDDQLYFFLFAAARETWLMNPDKLVPRGEMLWLEMVQELGAH